MLSRLPRNNICTEEHQVACAHLPVAQCVLACRLQKGVASQQAGSDAGFESARVEFASSSVLNVPPVHFDMRGSLKSINVKLAEGLHVVLAAGICSLEH